MVDGQVRIEDQRMDCGAEEQSPPENNGVALGRDGCPPEPPQECMDVREFCPDADPGCLVDYGELCCVPAGCAIPGCELTPQCGGEPPTVCGDGLCQADEPEWCPEDCGGRCGDGVECPDGTCVPPGDICPDPCPVVCPDGLCVQDPAECDAGPCGPDGFMCPDGLCVPAGAPCPAPPCGPDEFPCEDGTCALDPAECDPCAADPAACDPCGGGFQCPDGRCVADPIECDAGPCGPDGAMCPDGACVRAGDPCPGACPADMIECADGMCVFDPAECGPAVCEPDFEDCDGDGWLFPEDCDPFDARTAPNAPEVCDARDNNCDGVVDEGCAP